jgi:hypothetical protein
VPVFLLLQSEGRDGRDGRDVRAAIVGCCTIL